MELFFSFFFWFLVFGGEVGGRSECVRAREHGEAHESADGGRGADPRLLGALAR